MKTIGIIIGVILLSIIGVVVYAKTWWDDITFDLKIDKSKINLQSILSNLIVNQNVLLPIQLIVNNKNNVGLSLENVSIKMFYNEKQVLQSQSIKQLTIPANAKDFSIDLNVSIFANIESIKLINELIKKSKPETNIILSISKSFFGKQFTKEFEFKYNIEY